MELFFSERFKKDYKLFSGDIKQVINSKLKILSEKKIRGREDIFETSINMHIRMTCNYYEGKILLRNFK